MSLNLRGSGVDISNKFENLMAPVVGGPLTTAILITICVVLIILFAYNGNNIGKIIFWTMLTTVIILFLHDHVLCKQERTEAINRDYDMVNVPIPDNLVTKVGRAESPEPPKKPINIPTLSVERRKDYNSTGTY